MMHRFKAVLGWRPLNGWRAFIGEVGVVLLGVLLALGAQQAIEEWNWRQEREYTEKALKEEVLDAAGSANERLMVDGCLRSRLLELSDRLASGGRWRGNPMRLAQARAYKPLFPEVYRMPKRLYLDDAWSVATASGVLTHIDRARVAQYSVLYSVIDVMRATQERERTAAAQLTFLNRDQMLDTRARIDAQTALATLDQANTQLTGSALQLLDALREMRLGYDPALTAQMTAETEKAQRRLRGACVRRVELSL